jgi:succinate dehydrogenase / fumarate reductase cytochrome b subunit
VAGASANPGDNMQRAATFFGSSIGKKVVMAASGLVLYGFVIGHMVGNLQIYLGPKAINDYGEFLQHFLHGQGIWIARGALLVAVGLR